ncbi:MAG: glycosyltransferase family 2 protein [Sphingomonadales bacterium]
MQLAEGISVVIPNYNGRALLPLILPPAFMALQKTNLPFEVIVADDASSDDSVGWLASNYSEIKVVVATQNAGFSATANRGIRAAQFNWVLLLNSDVILTPDYFEQLLPYRTIPNILGVSARIIGWDDDQLQEGGKYPVLQGAKIKTGYDFIPIEPTTQDRWPCFYLSGSNAFINKSVFETIGQFNELFSPFYVEDAELSLRAWRLGYASYYEHRAICRHRHAATILSSQKKKAVDRIYNRNKFFLHAIHLQGATLVSWMIQLLLELLFRVLTFRPGLLLSCIDLIKKIPAVRESRRALRNLRPDKKVVSVTTVFLEIVRQLPETQIKILKR